MTRPRRDPRIWRTGMAVAGRERPRFDLAKRPDGGRPRRDPRAEAQRQLVEAPTRLRLDRTQRTSTLASGAIAPATVPTAAPTIIVMESPAFLVAVVPDAPGGRLTAHDRQLFGAARTLAGASGAVVAFVVDGVEDLSAAGADRVAALPPEYGCAYDPDGDAAAVVALCRALAPRHVLFAETPTGGDLARRIAATTGDDLFPDAEIIAATSLVRAARGRRIEQRGAPTRLITLAADAASAYTGPPREARVEDIAAIESPIRTSAIRDARLVPADPARVPLSVADFVTAAGNGITDFPTFHRLVAALGATPGASRVLCDSGLMPREAQVGASGTVLAATCYVALGIAGAPQHLQGVAGCDHVVAVNTDLHAAMIERAGLAIVQDAQLVMPALLALLEQESGGPA